MTKKEYILDFLKEINYAYNHPSMYDDLKRLLDEMQEEILGSANCKWIPVSERLPEEEGIYLCSYDYDIVNTSYFDIRMNEFNVFHEQVTAWMYLPEPYQPEITTGEEGSEE